VTEGCCALSGGDIYNSTAGTGGEEGFKNQSASCKGPFPKIVFPQLENATNEVKKENL
jgi:hypothetical protein